MCLYKDGYDGLSFLKFLSEMKSSQIHRLSVNKNVLIISFTIIKRNECLRKGIDIN